MQNKNEANSKLIITFTSLALVRRKGQGTQRGTHNKHTNTHTHKKKEKKSAVKRGTAAAWPNYTELQWTSGRLPAAAPQTPSSFLNPCCSGATKNRFLAILHAFGYLPLALQLVAVLRVHFHLAKHFIQPRRYDAAAAPATTIETHTTHAARRISTASNLACRFAVDGMR